MKTCKQCGKAKSDDEFYARHSSCKECTKKRVRANRREKLEYYRDYDRNRANKPKRVAARAAYSKTQAGKEALRRASIAWRERNPEKRKAHIAVGNAIRDGKLKKQPCEVCDTTENIEAHHDDYSKPLDVRWLCVTHHAEHHVLEQSEARKSA